MKKVAVLFMAVIAITTFAGSSKAYAANYDWDYPGLVQGNASTYPTLREGDTGELVSFLQTMLNSWRPFTGNVYDQVVVDGAFGSRTKTAVIGFQGAFSLQPDGIVGLKTWTQILKYAN